MPAPSRPNFVRRLLSFSRQLSSRPSRRGRMCKKTVTTKDGRLGSVGGHGVDVAEAARACAAPGIGQNSTRAGAAEFWAMSGAATKLPPKKLLQRHAGPSQRAAGQLLWRCAPCGLRKRAKTQLDLRRLRRDSSRKRGVSRRRLITPSTRKRCTRYLRIYLIINSDRRERNNPRRPGG